MTAAALALTAVWFATAFVLRIGIQLRRTGDSGVRLHNGSMMALLAKVLFTTATLAVGLAPAFVATDGAPFAIEVLGVVLACGGILATFGAQLAMGRSWRIGVDPDERTDLVTDGLFAIVRNPIFSTMLVTAIGLVLMVPTVVGVVSLALLFVAIELQVRVVEEPYLRGVHGRAFDAYVARVGRFVPGLGLGT